MEHAYPLITTMIVMRNEEQFIGAALGSLLEQDYPKNRYEIILIDGLSSDRTLDIAKKTVQDYRALHGESACPSVMYLENPKLILATGWNLGIDKAKGDFLVRIDAHASVESNFLSLSIRTLLETPDAVCVGGTLQTRGESKIGKLISCALSSPFGVGGSKFRYQSTPGYVDTVAYGLYRKSVFQSLGGFDETLKRTQDNDFHRKIREAGGKFFLNPDIKVVYYSRNTLGSLLRQQYNNGKWTMINFWKRTGKMALRHFIPFFFVIALFCAILLDIFRVTPCFLSLILLGLHMLLGTFFAVGKKCGELTVYMPFLFILIHLAYGLGSFSGILSQSGK